MGNEWEIACAFENNPNLILLSTDIISKDEIANESCSPTNECYSCIEH